MKQSKKLYRRISEILNEMKSKHFPLVIIYRQKHISQNLSSTRSRKSSPLPRENIFDASKNTQYLKYQIPEFSLPTSRTDSFIQVFPNTFFLLGFLNKILPPPRLPVQIHLYRFSPILSFYWIFLIRFSPSTSRTDSFIQVFPNTFFLLDFLDKILPPPDFPYRIIYIAFP